MPTPTPSTPSSNSGGRLKRQESETTILNALLKRVSALERFSSYAALTSDETHLPGDLIPSAANTRAGCLICDGSAYAREAYPELFAALKDTPYGVGDGSTTFTVPDFRGRVPIGAGTGTAHGATEHALGTTPTTGPGGEEAHVSTVSEMPPHNHGGATGTGTTSTGTTGAGSTGTGTTVSNTTGTGTTVSNSTGAGTTVSNSTGTAPATGIESVAHNHFMPGLSIPQLTGSFQAFNLGTGAPTSSFAIPRISGAGGASDYTATAASTTGSGTSGAESGTHTHSVPSLSIPSLTVNAMSIPSLVVNAMSIPSLVVNALSIPGLSIPGLSIPALSITSQGSGAAHNIMQPSTVINWFIKT